MESASLRSQIYRLPTQGGLECCAANAVLLASEIMLGKRIIFSRLYLYYMTRKLRDDLSLTGVRLQQTFQAFQQYGACLEDDWPLVLGKVNTEPTEYAIREASYCKLKSFKSIPIDQYKSCIDNKTPIILGMSTGEKFWFLRGRLEDQRYKPINGTDNRQSKGHAVVCVGYDDNLNGGSWIIANSLGAIWGSHGYAAIPYECGINIGESYIITGFDGIPLDKKISHFDK